MVEPGKRMTRVDKNHWIQEVMFLRELSLNHSQPVSARSAANVYNLPYQTMELCCERLSARGVITQCGVDSIRDKVWKLVDYGGED